MGENANSGMGQTLRIHKDESERSDIVYFRKCFTFLFALSAYLVYFIADVIAISHPLSDKFSFISPTYLRFHFTIIVCYNAKCYRLELAHTLHENG